MPTVTLCRASSTSPLDKPARFVSTATHGGDTPLEHAQLQPASSGQAPQLVTFGDDSAHAIAHCCARSAAVSEAQRQAG